MLFTFQKEVFYQVFLIRTPWLWCYNSFIVGYIYCIGGFFVALLVVDGRRFRSIREACNTYNVNYSKVTRRIRNGMSLEEAVKLVTRADYGKRSIEVGGVVYKSLKEACRELGVNYYTVSAKVRYGMGVLEALESTRKSVTHRDLTVDGVRFSSIREACETYDAVYSTVITRMRNGKTLEEAVKVQGDARCKSIEIDGRLFKSLSEACRYYKIDYGYVRYQVRKGLDIKDAIKKVHMKYGI